MDRILEDAHDRPKGPIDHLVVLHSDINENSTRYENLVSAPSYEVQDIMWLVWSMISAICAGTVLLVFLGIASSPIRQKTFNIYLLCLMAPDFLFSFLCMITCSQNYVLGYYSSIQMCRWQAFYSMFSISSNAWLNAIVCKQVHSMLVCVKNGESYRPPHKVQVIGHAVLVYLWSLFVASWIYVGVPLDDYGIRWWPQRAILISGVACLPMDFDPVSSVFFYFVFFPCLLGIPLGYILYAMINIYRNDLLPPKGKRRQMTIFFFRLILVFIVMWVPSILLVYILGQIQGPWVAWLGGSWMHFQAAVSSVVSLCKPDVYDAVKKFVTCQCRRAWADNSARRKQRRSQTTAKKRAKRLRKYTKELKKVQREIEKAKERIDEKSCDASSKKQKHCPKSSYIKELEEVAKELEANKEHVAQESANSQMDLLEVQETDFVADMIGNSGNDNHNNHNHNNHSGMTSWNGVDILALLDQAKINTSIVVVHEDSLEESDSDTLTETDPRLSSNFSDLEEGSPVEQQQQELPPSDEDASVMIEFTTTESSCCTSASTEEEDVLDYEV